MASIYPGRFDFEGIFLIGREELKELDSLIDDAKKKIDAYVKKRISDKAKEDAERRCIDVDDKEAFDKLQKEVAKEAWDFKDGSSRIAVVKCKSKKTYADTKFEKVMNIAELGDEQPISVTSSYANGRSNAELEVDTSSNKIRISVSGGDDLEREVVGPFIDWIQSKQRIEHWRRFNSNFLGFAVFAFGMVLVWLLFTQVRTTTERPNLVAKASEIVKGGIEQDEIPEAIEYLLRLNAGLYESREELRPQSWYIGLIVIWAIAFAAFYLTPKTVIGVGLNDFTMKRYEFSIRVGSWLGICIAGFLVVRLLWTLVSLFGE